MNKSELKTGMLVQTQNGSWWIVQKDTEEISCYGGNGIIVKYSDGEFMDLAGYDDNLTRSSYGYDITKVATVNHPRLTLKGLVEKIPPEQLRDFKVIWQRENPKKQQLTELVDKLRGQLKEAQDKLEAM